ncbi:MAG: DUF58 domain-containing protein [Planctomycetaceae bacterium]
MKTNDAPVDQSTAASRSASIDPGTIMRIKDLQLRARAVVEGFLNGLHRSPYHGFSVEFSEYRPYSTGDDPRGLDWKLYARSDRYFVKKFEDETNRRCYLVVDQSQSMGFGSLEYSKVEYARTLAATLAYYLSMQRDGVGLVTFDERIDQYFPARHRPGHLRQLMIALMRPLAGNGTNIGAPLDHLAKLVSKRGLVILISDLLVPVEPLRAKLALLRSRRHEVMILRTLDPAELALQIESPGFVVDMETGRDIYIDPQVAAKDYTRQFESHRDQIKLICDHLGIDLFQVATDRPLQASLFDILSAQQQRGRVTARHSGAASGTPSGRAS